MTSDGQHTLLIQFVDIMGARRVGVLRGENVTPLDEVASIYELARTACKRGTSLRGLIDQHETRDAVAYADLADEGRVLSPIDHPDPAHLLVTGTGLTHLGSAKTRHNIHGGADDAPLTDSMKMFRMGVEGGKPRPGEVGVAPEWFYKGDGSNVAPPFGVLPVPDFAWDGGEEPEICGIYVIDDEANPRRIGYALGNEFSDHKFEKENYLYLAHSKLRRSSFGPALLVGDLPEAVEGMSRIVRDESVVWEKPFITGEANMCHALANLEHHHFKYPQFRRPGDVHVHFFGTSTLSFADGFVAEAGDVCEIHAALFGPPLRNTIIAFGREDNAFEVRQL